MMRIFIIILFILYLSSCSGKEVSMINIEMMRKIEKIEIKTFKGEFLHVVNVNEELNYSVPSLNLDFDNDVVQFCIFYNKSQVNFIIPWSSKESNKVSLASQKKDSTILSIPGMYDTVFVSLGGNIYLDDYTSFIQRLDNINIHNNKHSEYSRRLIDFRDKTNYSQIAAYLLLHHVPFLDTNRQIEKQQFKTIVKESCEYNEGLYFLICQQESPGKIDCGSYSSIDSLVFSNSENSSVYQNGIGKIIVIDFFASWCIPCKPALFALDKLNKEIYMNEPVYFIGVSIDNDLDSMLSFQEKYRDSISTLGFHWDNGCMKKRYKISEIPQNYIYDKAGKLRYTNLSKEEMKEAIDLLLNE